MFRMKIFVTKDAHFIGICLSRKLACAKLRSIDYERLRKAICLFILFPHTLQLNTQCCWQCSEEPRTGLVLVTIGGTRPKQTTQIEDMTTDNISVDAILYL